LCDGTELLTTQIKNGEFLGAFFGGEGRLKSSGKLGLFGKRHYNVLIAIRKIFHDEATTGPGPNRELQRQRCKKLQRPEQPKAKKVCFYIEKAL
jgi:hypothetical protein